MAIESRQIEGVEFLINEHLGALRISQVSGIEQIDADDYRKGLKVVFRPQDTYGDIEMRVEFHRNDVLSSMVHYYLIGGSGVPMMTEDFFEFFENTSKMAGWTKQATEQTFDTYFND